MPDETIAIKIRELQLKVERLEEHDKRINKDLDETLTVLASINTMLNERAQHLTTFFDLIKRVKMLEDDALKKTVYNDVVKMVVGGVITLLVAHFIHKQVLLYKEEKNDYIIEKR